MKAKSRTSKRFGKLLALTLVMAMALTATATPLAFAKGVANGNEYVKAIPIYDTYAEAQAEAAELNQELTGEGSVLLKNDGALPLAKGSKVTVFGAAATSLQGGTGRVDNVLKDNGFTVNPTIVTESNYAKIEDAAIREYGNAAIVVLKRGGGEGSDLAVATKEVANDAEENVGGWTHACLAKDANGHEVKHNQMVTASELAMIEKAKATCDNVVVLLNTSNAMEMYNLEHDDAIDAIMFIGRPGANGIKAVGKLLNGTINPSGKLADIWYRDFTADPTWYNSIANAQNAAGSNSYIDKNGSASNGMHGVDYEEDIYLGYGYYESVYAEILEGRLTYKDGALAKGAPADAEKEADAWYADNVVYPFGYGLSYTEFDVDAIKLSRTELSAEEISSSEGNPAQIKTITVYATVWNDWGYPGKTVVEIYSQAPYDPAAGVEKTAVKLVGYTKTDIIQPGQCQRVAVTVNLQDMAYYSATTAHDGVKGAYVLDEGTYYLHVSDDSHCYGNSYYAAKLNITGKAVQGLDDYSDNLIQNVFSVENGRNYTTRQKTEGSLWAELNAFMEDEVLLSRADFVGTFPKPPVTTIKVGDQTLTTVPEFSANNDYSAGDYVKVTVVGTGMTGSSSVTYYKFKVDHAAGAFNAEEVELLEGSYMGGLVFSDEFLALMDYYTNWNLETYETKYAYFSASGSYKEGDKVGVSGSKAVYQFKADYTAPATVALQSYEAGAIIRSGSVIYKATKAITMPEFPAFDNTKAWAVGSYLKYNNRNYVVTKEIPVGGSVNTNRRNGNVTEFTAANLIITSGENANVEDFTAGYLATVADLLEEENAGWYKYSDKLFTGYDGANAKGEDGLYDVTADMIEGWSQMESAAAQKAASEAENSNWIWFNELAGIYYNSTEVIEGGRFDGMTGVQVWTQFMNQWTWKDFQEACWQGGNNGKSVANLGIPNGGVADSPTSFNGTYTWNCNCSIASSWNTELGYKQGALVASMGLLKNSTAMNNAKEQWLNPAVNMHRTPFSGRNNEYYSQDGMHAGIFAAAVSQGIQSVGVGSHLKHMFLNDQETNRNSKDLFAWVSEQAIRELYIKPFQMGIQEGGAEGAMSAFARVGAIPTPVSYNMCELLVRTEWGATNFFFHPDMYSPQSAVAGEDLMIRTGHNHAPGGTFSDNGTSGANAISGHWNATVENPLTGGIGGVMIGSGDNAYLSNNQWYIVRLRAMEMYSEYANQGHSRNGLLLTDYVGATDWEATTGEAAEFSVAYDADTVYESYAIARGNLPDGMTLDTATGAITGTPTKAGTYEFNVTATFDKWITQTNTYKITVAQGEEVIPEVDHGGVTSVTKATEGNTDTYTMTFADGTTYSFTVTNGQDGAPGAAGQDGKDGTNGTNGQDGAPGTNGTNGQDGAPGAAGKDGKDGVGFKSMTNKAVDGGTEYTVTLTNGETFTFTIKDGATVTASSSGCGGIIGIGAGILSVVTLLGAAVIVRKKND